MPLGPIELLVVKFPGNQFTGEIMPAIQELVENGVVQIVDLLLVTKNAQGEVTLFEFSDLDSDVFGQWAPLVTSSTPMLNDDDAYELAELLENNSSAGIVLFENTWATRFAEAIRNAKGDVMLNERIPRVVIEEIAAATA
jgi:uncharacterized membrane protein